MGSIVSDNGLQRMAVQTSQATAGAGPTYSASRHIQTMSIDDSATGFNSTTTTLGSPGNEYDAAFDATPVRSGQSVPHTMTVPTGSGNFTVRRTALHDNTPANVTGSSATFCAGVDGQSLTKTSDFTMGITQTLVYARPA